ncbi:MAG: hypothetical protein ABH874_07690 [Methanobacteriota archaeon]
MGEAVLNDKDLVKKAFSLLEKEMSLVEYTRFLQLITPSKGDLTKELVEKRKKLNVDAAYEKFLKRIKK